MNSSADTNTSSRDRLVENLMNLGLTSYEAKSYLTLAKYGELTSTDLVKLTGIPHLEFTMWFLHYKEKA